MVVSRVKFCKRLKNNEHAETARALLETEIAHHYMGLNSSLTSNIREDRFICSSQCVEVEHTVLDNARGTLDSLASILVFLPTVSSDQQLRTTMLLR